MDVVLIYNGLGNQMSQYSLYLRKKTEGQNVRYICLNTAHNGIELGRLFGIDVRMRLLDHILILLYHFISTDKLPVLFKPVQGLLSLMGVSVLREEGSYAFNAGAVLQGTNKLRFLSGGWHHYEYFTVIEDKVRAAFQFPNIMDERNVEVIKESMASNAVAIHVRRGDFLDKNNYEKFGKVCSQDYYRRALKIVSENIEDPSFFVFTNDIAWSRSFFENKKVKFVDWNTSVNSWKDLYLMSCFKNIIIANSTFSWWAAWLGKENNMKGAVLCPSKFVSSESSAEESIYPKRWCKVN